MGLEPKFPKETRRITNQVFDVAQAGQENVAAIPLLHKIAKILLARKVNSKG
jgi:hypothetical protein